MKDSNFSGEQFSLLQQRKLLGERDVPFNPEFLKSGYAKVMIQRYEGVRDLCKGKTVLDAGCGLGWGADIVSKRALKVVGIDSDPDTIAYCRETYPHKNTEFKVMDCRRLTFSDDTFDVVLLMETIEHMTREDGHACLSSIIGCLKPEGILIGTTYIAPGEQERTAHLQHSENEYHLHIYTKQEMEDLLGRFFNHYEIAGLSTFIASVPRKAGQSEAAGYERADDQKRKKRVLLATSAAPAQSPFSTGEKRPPIGVGFLISVLRNAGHTVTFIDNYLAPSDFLETDYLLKNNIDFIGIYVNSICFRDTLRMLYKMEYLRQTGKWNGKIIVGGPHATVAPETIPEFVDYVVRGEGEKAIIDIVEGRVRDRIVQYPSIKNLDELPMPAWDYFVNLPYTWSVDWFPEQPVFTMNTSRGCPFNCSFCSVDSIWGRKYNYFSPERLVADIEYLINNYGARGIYFREDNFTLNKNRLTAFCNLLIERGIQIPWACETRVNSLNREMVALMHRAGARAFYLGVESGSQKVLDFLQKGITVEQIRKAFQLCREFGLKTAASVIVGTPHETEEDIQKTARLLEEVKPSVTWYNVFVGIPRSRLYHYVLDNKLYEFIDDRGLVYLKGHNQRVKRFYGNQWNAALPVSLHKNSVINPEVSVVMPVYNKGKYLRKAVESILSQTFQNFEFIIIDDASSDESAEILSSYDDPRIRIIKNPENAGLTKSLNRGIETARGVFLARMDGDDISLPHRFERQVEFLRQNNEYALVGSSYYEIDEQGKINKLIRVLTDDSRIREELHKQNWFGHGSVMMRRDAFCAVGGYNEKYQYSQDYDLWLRLSEKYRVANTEEPLYCWRSTSSGISCDKAEEQRQYASLAVSEARGRIKACPSRDVPEIMVSVVLPTHNRPGMLREALESIFAQTFRDFEIIVVNDAGADVEAVVTDLNSSHTITYVRHGRNRGLAAARNTALRLARGKYIAYLDDDDIFYPDHLETLVSCLEGSDYKIAYTDACRAHQEEKSGNYIITGKDTPYSYDFRYDDILVTNFIPVLCVMHEKSCLDETGLFDESLPVLEDWDLWIRLSRKYKLEHIKKVTAEFRWRPDGSSMTSYEGKSVFYRTGRRIHEKYREHSRNRHQILDAQKQAYFRDELQLLQIKSPDRASRLNQSIKNANRFISGNEMEKAIAAYADMSANYPDIDLFYPVLCDLYLSLNRSDIPGEWLIKGLRYDYSLVSAVRERAGELMAAEKYTEAKTYLEALAAVYPDDKGVPEMIGYVRKNILEAEKKISGPAGEEKLKCAGKQGKGSESLKKIAVVRGANLNTWETQNYEPLIGRYDITAYATTQGYFDTGQIKLPVKRLPFSSGGLLLHMEGLEDELAGTDLVYCPDITFAFSAQAVRAKVRHGYKVLCLEWENIPFIHEDHDEARRIKETVRKGADHFLAVTDRAKEALMLEGVPAEKIDVVPLGIDLTRFRPMEEKRDEFRKQFNFSAKDIVLLYIGRMVWEKGVYDLLNAAARLVRDQSLSGERVRLLMVGNGPELGDVRRRVEILGISTMVTVLEYCPYQEIHKLHNIADIFVLPSIPTRQWQEQFGMVLIESMACGTPVLSTLSGSIPEVVGDAGILVQPNDHLSLYLAMKSLIKRRPQRESLGRKALQRAQDLYDSREAAKKIGMIFDRLMTKSSDRSNGRTLCITGEFREQKTGHEAFVQLCRTFREDPDRKDMLDSIIKTGRELKQLQAVEDAIREYLMYHPASLEVLTTLAEILLESEEFDQAREELRKVLLFDPENKRAFGLLEKINDRKLCALNAKSTGA